MRARVLVGCVSVSILWILLSLVQVHGEGAGVQGGTGPLQQRVAELEKALAELKDANSMLMENLMNCMEENADRSSGGGEGAAVPTTESSSKRILVHRLEEALQTDGGLTFLLGLDQGDVEFLLDLVEKRLGNKQSGGFGK